MFKPLTQKNVTKSAWTDGQSVNREKFLSTDLVCKGEGQGGVGRGREGREREGKD